jgi:prephenate dehydrogenase
MRIIQLPPDDHDRLICDISHLPHAVAAALVSMQADEALPLAGKGFLDSTRIAGGDGGLWRDIFLENRDNLAASTRRLRDRLDELLRMLDAGEGDAVRDWLTTAADRREKLLQQKLRELNAD